MCSLKYSRTIRYPTWIIRWSFFMKELTTGTRSYFNNYQLKFIYLQLSPSICYVSFKNIHQLLKTCICNLITTKTESKKVKQNLVFDPGNDKWLSFSYYKKRTCQENQPSNHSWFACAIDSSKHLFWFPFHRANEKPKKKEWKDEMLIRNNFQIHFDKNYLHK